MPLNFSAEWGKLCHQYNQVALNSDLLDLYPACSSLGDVLKTIDLCDTWPAVTFSNISSLMQFARAIKQANDNLVFEDIFLDKPDATLTHIIWDCIAKYESSAGYVNNQIQEYKKNLSTESDEYFYCSDLPVINQGEDECVSFDKVEGGENSIDVDYHFDHITAVIKSCEENQSADASQISYAQLQNDLLQMNTLKEIIRTILMSATLQKNRDDITYCQDVIKYLASQYKNLSLAIDEQYSEINKFILDYNNSESKSDDRKKNAIELMLVALIREVRYREKGGKQWLRLEQILSILLLVRHNVVLQIDTGEGKTDIAGLSALINAMLGENTTIITHTLHEAKEGYSNIKRLAFALTKNPKIASEYSSKEQGCIHYTELTLGVIQVMSDKALRDASNANKDQRNYIFDEVDALLIDIGGSRTMQYTHKNASHPYSENTVYNAFLDVILSLGESEKSCDALLTKISADQNAQKYWEQDVIAPLKLQSEKVIAVSNMILEKWLDSLKIVDQLDYGYEFAISRNLINPNFFEINIVDRGVTGSMDTDGEWSSGVHGLIARREARKDENKEKNIIIPQPKNVLMESSSLQYIYDLKDRSIKMSGISGTLGLDNERNLLTENLNAELIVMPRAKRCKQEDDVKMPRILNSENHPIKSSNLRLDESSLLATTQKQQFKLIVNRIEICYHQNYSIIVFLDAIKDCHEFKQYLEENWFTDSSCKEHIQLYDDTTVEEDLRLTEKKTFNQNASNKKMISITHTCSARGFNLKDVDVLIDASYPRHNRVVQQTLGRVARNFTFGMTFRIPLLPDLFVDEYDETKIRKSIRILRELKRIVATKNNKMRQKKWTELKQHNDFNENIFLKSNWIGELDHTIKIVSCKDRMEKLKALNLLPITTLDSLIRERQVKTADNACDEAKKLRNECRIKDELRGMVQYDLNEENSIALRRWSLFSDQVPIKLNSERIECQKNGRYAFGDQSSLQLIWNDVYGDQYEDHEIYKRIFP